MVATANLKAEVAAEVLEVVERLEAVVAVERSGVVEVVRVERSEGVGAEKLGAVVAENGKVVVAKLEASNEWEGAPSEKVVAWILNAKETKGEVPNQEGGVDLLEAGAGAAVVRPREAAGAAADSQMVAEAVAYRMVVGVGGEGVCQMEVEEAEALRAEEVGARDSSGKMRQAWEREE